MELDVWAGDWSLASIEPNCLAVTAYCKFSNVPIKINTTNNVWKSRTGTLPNLRNEDMHMTNVNAIFDHLREQNYGCEFELSVLQSADMLAFIAMVEQKLAPAVHHLWWIDAKNYSELIRPWFGRALGLPLSLYYPNKMRDTYYQKVYDSHPYLTEDDVNMKIYREARECMNHLSAKLSNQDFFFGANPTALDAVVYGYLAPLLKVPFQSNSLTGHLKAMDNLQAFISRIQFRYFAQEVHDAKIKQEEKDKETKEHLDEFPHKKRDIVLAAIVASAAMIGYAIFSGLVQIQITHESDEPVDIPVPQSSGDNK